MPLNGDDLDLDLYFLGPKSEQRQLLQEALQLVVSDHIFWRRNYYPKDPPSIPYPNVEGEEARLYREAFFTQLFTLISDLKLDVPIFSPRYMAHMLSETTLPALVAYFATLLYNPNNVTSEASPVTIRYELEIGRQFAELFGFPVETSFGHLTSGGTIANYESIWYHTAGRLLPVALDLARRDHGMDCRSADPDLLWELLNMPLERVEGDLYGFLSAHEEGPESGFELLRHYLPSYLGDSEFQRKVESVYGAHWKQPVILAPRTAHYSWSRAVSLLGIGKFNLLPIDVDESFKIIPEDYRSVLESCLESRRPVIQTVAIVGSTEFGSVDPVHEMIRIRDEILERGLYTPVHVDAAYGGYFTTIFRPGERHKAVDEAALFRFNPWIPDAFRAMKECDSVTVDPHKAGYVPYGAGSIVFRHGFLKDLIAETAPYCLDAEDSTNRTPQLGKFILEGSRPGAAAASTWFSHRLIPLNLDGYGRQLGILCRIARRFDAMVRDLGDQAGNNVRLISVLRPHTNIVCLFALPENARSLSLLNRLNRSITERFGIRDVLSIQSYDYLVSHTAISADLSYFQSENVLSDLVADTDQVEVIRLVFMNRWVEEKEAGGKTYLEDFLQKLQAEASTIWENIQEAR